MDISQTHRLRACQIGAPYFSAGGKEKFCCGRLFYQKQIQALPVMKDMDLATICINDIANIAQAGII